MSVHPMIRTNLVTRLDEPKVYKLAIAYPEGQWVYEDAAYGSEAEALAAVPELQLTKRLPSDEELTSAAGR